MKIKTIAYYLPQFHPIPENNIWHGEGFTEWTNVGKAKPLFKGHYQPHVPADLGYYDLRLEETRIQQAQMASRYGIDGFCYWHYWFGNGKRLLDLPFQQVLSSGRPDFPFCLAWANETWKGIWHGISKNKTLIEQRYLGQADYVAHFESLVDAFTDKRYIFVGNKPVFVLYKPFSIPDLGLFLSTWDKLAKDQGWDGIHFVGHTTNIQEVEKLMGIGFNAVNLVRLYGILDVNRPSFMEKVLHKLKLRYHNVFPYSEAMKYFNGVEDQLPYCYPTLIPNWDHSPRSGLKGFVLTEASPELFRKHVRTTLESIKNKKDEEKIVFIKSWNEWGEGNHLEPDLKFGKGHLEVLLEELDNLK